MNILLCVSDGPGGCHSQAVRSEGRRLVSGHYGHRNGRGRAALPERESNQGTFYYSLIFSIFFHFSGDCKILHTKHKLIPTISGDLPHCNQWETALWKQRTAVTVLQGDFSEHYIAFVLILYKASTLIPYVAVFSSLNLVPFAGLYRLCPGRVG